MPEPTRLAIVTASEAEAACVRRRLEVRGKLVQPPGTLWYGRLQAQEVVLLRCGMGPERAVAGLRWLCRCSRLRGVINVGFAGGLQRQLATGDAVLVTHIGMTQGTLRRHAPDMTPDRALAALAAAAAGRAGLGRHRGLLLSSADLVPWAADKQGLGEQSGALAIDMESYSLACAAAAYLLPFASLRTIFDTCHDDLYVPVDVCTTLDGRLRRGRLLGHAVRHPQTLLGLPRLWYNAHRAAKQLGTWLDHFFAILEQRAACVCLCHDSPLAITREAEAEPEEQEL